MAFCTQVENEMNYLVLIIIYERVLNFEVCFDHFGQLLSIIGGRWRTFFFLIYTYLLDEAHLINLNIL